MAPSDSEAPAPFGRLLADARRRRGLSQLQLALAADVSSRHLCFLELGRSRPSAAMVRRLAATLELDPTHEDLLLQAAGFAHGALALRAPALRPGSAVPATIAQAAFEAALQVQASRTAARAFALAGAHLGALGLDHFYAGRLRKGSDGAAEVTFYKGGRPAVGWMTHYRENGYRPHDPLVAATSVRSAPFFWSEIVGDGGRLTPKCRRMFDEARAFGIAEGLVIPLRVGPDEVRAVSAMAERLDRQDPQIALSARLVGAALLEALERLEAPGSVDHPSLPEELAEPLRWLSAGRPPAWIAERLNLTDRELDDRLARACRALGASDVLQASLRAEQLGLLGATR